jgi:acylphosphatase
MITVHLEIKGKVQGVFFRGHIKEVCEEIWRFRMDKKYR